MCCSLVRAQEQDFLQAKVLDQKTGEPVVFATVRLIGKAKGVITNMDGSFRLPLSYMGEIESIEVSSMGYETKQILIDPFLEGSSNIVMLNPSIFELSEAVISAKLKRMSARQIVKVAVNSITENYPKDSFSLAGYYRDFQIKNAKYFNVNEAILKVFDKGFVELDNYGNEYQLFSYRKNLNFGNDSLAKQPYDYQNNAKVIPGARMENTGGNELYALNMHDAIRNYQTDTYSYIDNMPSDYVEGHRFRLNGKTNYQDEIVYEIESYYSNKEYFSEGKIFINTENFAILKLDYAVFKRRKPDRSLIIINPEERFSDGFNKSARELIYQIKTEYAKGEDEKMFLNYISFYNKALVERPVDFKSIFVIDLKARVFEVRLKKTPVDIDKIKINDFKIRYQQQLLPIKKIAFLKKRNVFMLTPDFRKIPTRSTLDYLFTKNDSLKITDLSYTYGNIRDTLGNRLDQRKWEYIHQYREFFTQETFPNLFRIPTQDSLMIKYLPLEHKRQPICSTCNSSNYWMNTPLKTTNN
jgi:hypothetical protein